ncbi:MAG: Ppx/GppA family phosphatase [Synergistaceae bacterium]|nr:Ppx/GppA family phosphatase [Synergistaceae bacterium]
MEQTMKDSPVVALVDLGSNSVRLMVVRIDPNKTHTVLTRFKQMVRLGEGAFTDKRLKERAIRRTIEAIHNIAEIRKGYNAVDLVACTTAAVRDAKNGAEFVKRTAKETGIRFAVISGLEEARLIQIGVASDLRFAENNTSLFIDIGGGSTELSVGRGAESLYLDSLKLGAVRVANAFPYVSGQNPIPLKLYDEIRLYVHNNSLRSIQKLRGIKLDTIVGSSGTIENLAEISAGGERIADSRKNDSHLHISLKALSDTAKKLCSVSLEDRKKIPGIQPQRADIIVAGAAVLQTIMEDLGMEELQVSQRGLLDGMLQDYLFRGKYAYLDKADSFREQSVLRLARSCGFNEIHSKWMGRLALELFDSAAELKLHQYGQAERELLYYSGLLHDIGIFLSFSKHHVHSRYIIKNAELLGFNREEIDVMSNAAYFHRKWSPKKSNIDSLHKIIDPKIQEIGKILGLFLRMSENLDRSQQQTVASATLARCGKDVELRLTLSGPSSTELYSIEKSRPSFKKIFGHDLRVVVNAAEC